MSVFPLNPAQLAAVAHGAGPALVLAGAGSGKTRVITQRIARLIEVGNLPRTIAALTFTNKAAEEMQERLLGVVGPSAKDVWISTFHALGGEIVRREMPRGSAFVVYDAADTGGLIKEILRERPTEVDGKRLDSGAILARISHAKNAMCAPEELVAPGEANEYDELAAWVYPRYQAALQRLRALDFDDLILWPLQKLTEDEATREKWRAKMRYLLVDEFQDTNRAQLLLVKQLVGPSGNVFCVGDDDQSIYGWRGADIANVIDFGSHFPGAKKLALEQNYRSRRPVLEVANAIMEGQVRAFPKRLFTDREGGSPVKVVHCDSGEGEVKFVFGTIQKLLAKGYKKKEIGVLYRSNLLSRGIEEALRLNNIPYRLIGGTSVYERREVKDLIAYLRLAVYPHDEISFRRVVNYPARGIGDVTLHRLEKYSLARGVALLETAEHSATIPDLSASTRESLLAFARIVRATRVQLEKGVGLSTVAAQVARTIKLKEDIFAAGPTAVVASRRWGNVEQLLKTMDKAAATTIGEVGAVLQRLTLRFAEEEEQHQDQVTLSTLHGSKGLEFGTVFFLGCEEGIIPHSRTDAPRATDILSTIDAGEERRLFYVGVTRAKEQLYLMRAVKRAASRGGAKTTMQTRFLTLPTLPEGMMVSETFNSEAPLQVVDIAAQAKRFREGLLAKKG
ncbi:MAG: hypothetical protein EPO40_37730 [Myxococcaceae bacterium]|nr:MAG: hypothetical protein EPO40_37730 [Myxococcaceae bacterium]